LNSSTAAAGAFQPAPSADVVVGSPIFAERADGAFSGEATATVPNAFLSLLGIPTYQVRVSSLANVRRAQSNVCLTALGVGTSGLDRGGSGDVSAANCRFDIRSVHTPAASLGGNGGSVTTSDLCVRGSTVYGSAVNLRVNCTIDNPLKVRTKAPTPSSVCASERTSRTINTGTVTLSPGTYCGPLRITGGTVTLAPGEYIFKSNTDGAGFEVTGGAVTGNDVFLYFPQASNLNLGGGTVTLTAPTAGTYKGVLFHEVAGLTPTNVSLHRSSGAVLRGLINLPSRNFTVSGSSSAVMDEVNMIVNRLSTHGSGTWTFKAGPVSTFQVGTPYLAS
jgi:hypothetical protein